MNAFKIDEALTSEDTGRLIVDHTVNGIKLPYEDNEENNVQSVTPIYTNELTERTFDPLTHLLATASKINEAASKKVVASEPLIKYDDSPVVRRNTIVLIQGKFGSHKSRLAELIAALFLSLHTNKKRYLNFTKSVIERFAVAFIDSERNITEEFPDAIQRIRSHAGYDPYDSVDGFFFTSIKDLERKQRLKAVESYLRHIRSQTELHLIVFIDVATDAVKSFNDDVEAMAFYDFIGQMCDRHNCTIFLVVHENPGGIEGKARGHIGTEGGNKAATVLSIGIMKDGDERTDVVRIRFQKLRAKPLPDIYAEFDPETRSLKLADPDKVSALRESLGVLPVEDLTLFLSDFITAPITATALQEAIKNKFSVGSKNTINDRLSQVIESGCVIQSQHFGESCLQVTKEGNRNMYRMVPIGKVGSVSSDPI